MVEWIFAMVVVVVGCGEHKHKFLVTSYLLLFASLAGHMNYRLCIVFEENLFYSRP